MRRVCPAAFPGQSFADQGIHHSLKPIIVAAFTKPVVEVDPQTLIHALQALKRITYTLRPDRLIFLISLLELHQFLPTGVLGRLVLLAGIVGTAVEAEKLAQRVLLEGLPVEILLPGPYHHPELRSPIADVVVGDHFMTQEPPNPRQRVANDGRTDVPDMHRLGHVGSGKIEHDPFLLKDRAHS